MNKLMNEKQVKKALKIDSFNDIDNKQASLFVNMLSKIDKNVAIKAFEQSEKILINVKEVLAQSLKSIDSIVKSSDDSIKSLNVNYKEIIKALIKKLDEKDISSEDKRYIIDKIIEIQKMQHQDNAEHRNLIIKIFSVFALFFLGLFGIKKNFDDK